MSLPFECSECGNSFNTVWQCTDCGALVCDSCSKGGISTHLGSKIIRGYLALATYGISEVVRATYRKHNQKCTLCNGIELAKMGDNPETTFESIMQEVKDRFITKIPVENIGLEPTVVLDPGTELTKVVAESEEVHIPKGAKIIIKRSRKVERTINIAWQVGGAISVDAGIKMMLTARINGELARSHGKSYLESEIKEYEIELSGTESTYYKLVWVDLWRIGNVEFFHEEVFRRIPFRVREGAQLKVIPVREEPTSSNI